MNIQRTGDDGVIETIPVEVSIGLKDNRYTQITSGLTEGDSVLLGELSAPVRTFGGPGRPGQ